MITKQINLYSFSELSDEVKEKVISKFREQNDYFFLEEYLNELLTEKLNKRGIKAENLKLYYSLSYSQGDGVCFVGNFEIMGVKIFIKHYGNYYHEKSVNFELEIDEFSLINELGFKQIYENICKELGKEGYAYIDAENDENTIKENIEANEYYFTENGRIEVLE